jgi:hypothetical protein
MAQSTVAEKPHLETRTEVKHGRLHQNLSTYVALTAAIMAALAGISSLLMARHGGRATSQLIQSTNYWNYYQAKSLKSYILTSEGVTLNALGKPQDEKAAAKLAQIEQEKNEIKKQAEDAAANSKLQGFFSGLLGTAVTFFQIAIANAAIAALSKKPPFWFVSLILAAVGIGYFIYYALLVNGFLAVSMAG